MNKRLLINLVVGLGVLALTGAGLAALMLTRPRPAQHRPEKKVRKVPAPRIRIQKNYHADIVGYGSARPRIRLEIIPQISGEVVAKADEALSGQTVRKGQMLFQIDRTDYEQSRRAAQKQIDLLKTRLNRLDQEKKNLEASARIERRRVALAKEQLKRARELYAKQVGGQTDLDNAEELMLLRKTGLQNLLNQLALIPSERNQLLAEIGVATVELDRTKTALARTTYTSPVTGRIVGCRVEVGERVQTGQVCGELYGTRIMEIPVSIPAGELQWIDRRRLAPSDKASLIEARVTWQASPVRSGGRKKTWQGFVHRIEAGLEEKTRTVTLVVQVDNPPGAAVSERLDLNMFCRVSIRGRILPEVFILPRSAMLPDSRVWVVHQGRLARREVRIARLTDEKAVIIPNQGLQSGDRVVISPIGRTVAGEPCKAIDSIQN